MTTGRPGALWIVVAALTAVLVACGSAGVGGPGGGVGAGNGAPTVDGTFSVNAVVGETVAFDATATDPEGQDLTFEWGLVQKPDGSSSTVSGADTLGASFVPDLAGTYVAELLVSDGTTQASFEFTIYVTQGVPGEPIVLNPADGAEDVSVGVSLQWDSDGASEYRVYLGTSNPPNVAADSVATDSYTPSEDLEYSTEYFWRIDATNADGTTTGAVWSFTTQDEPLQAPGAFDILSPTGDLPTVSLPLTIAWSSSSGAASYTVSITNSRSGAEIEKTGITARQWQVPIGEPSGVNYDSYYSVVIRAFNAAGSTDMDRGSQGFRTGPEPQLLPSDAAAHWPLGESVFKDVSGNGNDGTGYPIGAPPTAVPGRSGSSGGGHSFNGEGQHVLVPVDARRSTLSDYSRGFALSLWIDGASSVISGRGFVAQLGSGNEVGFALYGAQSTEQIRAPVTVLAFAADGAQAVAIEKATLPQEEWFHVVVNYDAGGGIIDFRLNGKIVGQTQGGITAAGDVYIGTISNELGYLAGALDDIRIFNRTLTAEEIAQLLEE